MLNKYKSDKCSLALCNHLPLQLHLQALWGYVSASIAHLHYRGKYSKQIPSSLSLDGACLWISTLKSYQRFSMGFMISELWPGLSATCWRSVSSAVTTRYPWQGKVYSILHLNHMIFVFLAFKANSSKKFCFRYWKIDSGWTKRIQNGINIQHLY